jgi:hypothetical protein
VDHAHYTFNTARTPLTARATGFLALVREIVLAHEKPRQRARKTTDAATFNASLSALVCNLAHRWIATDGEGWIIVPRSARILGRGDPILSTQLVGIVDTLERAGLITKELGWRDVSKRVPTSEPRAGLPR